MWDKRQSWSKKIFLFVSSHKKWILFGSELWDESFPTQMRLLRRKVRKNKIWKLSLFLKTVVGKLRISITFILRAKAEHRILDLPKNHSHLWSTHYQQKQCKIMQNIVNMISESYNFITLYLFKNYYLYYLLVRCMYTYQDRHICQIFRGRGLTNNNPGAIL